MVFEKCRYLESTYPPWVFKCRLVVVLVKSVSRDFCADFLAHTLIDDRWCGTHHCIFYQHVGWASLLVGVRETRSIVNLQNASFTTSSIYIILNFHYTNTSGLEPPPLSWVGLLTELKKLWRIDMILCVHVNMFTQGTA